LNSALVILAALLADVDCALNELLVKVAVVKFGFGGELVCSVEALLPLPI
jgi:hypothetical protein